MGPCVICAVYKSTCFLFFLFFVQGILAREVQELAGVPQGPCGLNEIAVFQVTLSDYQIVVVSVDHGYQIIYKGPMQEEEKKFILIKNGEHFQACNLIKGVLVATIIV